MPNQITLGDFMQCMDNYQFQAFGYGGLLDGLGLRGAPFPACAPTVIRRIHDPMGRHDAWFALAGFCIHSGDHAQEAACTLEAEALLMDIDKPSLRDTRILRLIQYLWLQAGERGKATAHCRTMALTEFRVRALLQVVDHDRKSGDAEASADMLTEAEAAARACPRPENRFEGCLVIGSWKRLREDVPGARVWFEEARKCLVLIRNPGKKPERLAEAFESLSEPLPALGEDRTQTDPPAESAPPACHVIRKWARSAPNPPGACCGFELAGECHVPLDPGELPALSEEDFLKTLERITPDPASIVDLIPPPD